METLEDFIKGKEYLIDRYHPHLDSQGEIFSLRSIYNWDMYYLGMAKYVSTKSKDPSTKAGAVIVRPDHSVASVGFNGFPQGMLDHPKLYADREEKYSRIIHAEINSMVFSQDTSMKGYTLYVYPLLPCDRCVGPLLQAGISRFVAPELPEELKPRWEESLNKTKKYILECNKICDEVPFK